MSEPTSPRSKHAALRDEVFRKVTAGIKSGASTSASSSDYNHQQHQHDRHTSQTQSRDDASEAHKHQDHSSHDHALMVMETSHDQMMTLAYENTPEGAKKANNIAHTLLEHAELPLAFRVHAHIVLASGKTDYLHHAKQAVHFAEMGRDIFGPGKTLEARAAVEDLLWQANEALRRAERDMELLKDLKERVKTGKLKLKKGEKLMYGNVNDDDHLAAKKPSDTDEFSDDKIAESKLIESGKKSSNERGC